MNCSVTFVSCQPCTLQTARAGRHRLTWCLSLSHLLSMLCGPASAQSPSKPGGGNPAARSAQRPQPRPNAAPSGQPQANKQAQAPKPPVGQSVLEPNESSAKANAKPAATKNIKADDKYVLQHRLQPGEIIRTRTTHLANTVTRIQGTEDISESRTSSDKIWEVKSVSPEGEMTFEYRIEAVDMSQKAGDAPEVKYNSRTDKEVPPIFAHVAKTISEPVALVTIDPTGKVIQRDNNPKTPPLGLGELAVALPKKRLLKGPSGASRARHG